MRPVLLHLYPFRIRPRRMREAAFWYYQNIAGSISQALKNGYPYDDEFYGERCCCRTEILQHARFLFPLVTKRRNRRENNTLAGGIKAVPAAGHGYHRSCAFIPKACGGNGVTSAGSCTAADRRRQLLQRSSSSRRSNLTGVFVLPARRAAPLLYIMWL